MKRKTLLTVMLLALLPLCLFADEYIAHWSWTNDDPDVTAYRYQLNSQDPDGWTVVTPDVTEYSCYIEDPSKDLTLYVQATYDGENWSGSADNVAPAPEPAPAEEAATPEEETPEVAEITAEEPASAEVTPIAPVAEVKTPVIKSGRWFVNDRLGLNVNVGSWSTGETSNVSSKARLAIIDKISAGYQFNEWFRLGLTTGFAYQFTSSDYKQGYMYIPLTIDTDFRVAKFGSVDLWTQLSVGLYDRIVNGKNQMGFMAGASLYAEYAISNNFMIGGGVGLTSFFSMFKKNNVLGLDTLLEVDPYLVCTYMF